MRLFWSAGPLERRLSLLTATAVALSMLITGLAAYVVTDLTLYDQLDRELLEVAQQQSPQIAGDIVNMGGLNSEALKAANVTLVLVRADNRQIQLPGEVTQLETGYQELAVARLQGATSARRGTASDERPYRIVAVPLTTGDADGDYALVIGRRLTPTTNVLQQLALVLMVFGLVMAVVSGFVGMWLARQALRPVQHLSTAVARVTETDELKPIDTTGDDELTDLARSFNTMLNSLESSRERQRRLIADAGHELRTPLTSMRTNVELLVADDKSGMLPEGARGEILRDIASQVTEFASLVGDLVQLSREEQVKPNPEPVELSEVVEAAVERAKRRGPGLEFDVRLEPHPLVGEADQLERAITNLLDNAVKFSPPGGTVKVSMENELLRVIDQGPGIAEEDLPKIFDRFYRSEKARNTPGTGLGLSIVHHIVSAHGGWVAAGRAPQGGAMFTMWLPSDTPDEEFDTVFPR